MNSNNSNNVSWSRNKVNENTAMPAQNNKYSTQSGVGMQTTVPQEMPFQ